MPRSLIVLLIGGFAIFSSGHVFTAEQNEPGPAAVGPRSGDDAGAPQTNGGGFQPRQLAEPDETDGSFGFSLGFVATFGSFRVPHHKPEHGHAMFLANGHHDEGYFFFDGEMHYQHFGCDPCFNVEGRIYRVHLPNGTVRYFLFGAKNVCCQCGVWQRWVIVYDHHWCRVSAVLANVGRTYH